MHKLRRSAAYRLAFGYTALCALAVLVMGLGVDYAAGAMLRRDLDRTIASETAALQREYSEGGYSDLADAIRKHRQRPGNVFRYALFAADRRVTLADARLPQASPGWGNVEVTEPGHPPLHARFLATRLAHGETLLVASDTHHLERLGTTLLMLLGAGFVATLGLGAAGAILLGRLLHRRLESISTTAEAVVAGDMTRRVVVGSHGDEFDRVGESLNLMLDRIAQLVDNLRQVSSDVAHDLRTPLQRLRGAIEAGLDGRQDLAALRLALMRAQDQSDALLALFEAILRICEVEAGAARERYEPADLADLAAGICEMYAPAIEDGGRTLLCSADQPVYAHGDRELLAQALTNLLDNAALHTPPGTVITVSARDCGSEAQLIVADTGGGVPDTDRERIVQRFVRLDQARMTRGHGLGLNLVAAIATAHGGRLTIENGQPGLRATLSLPVADPKRSAPAAAGRGGPTDVDARAGRPSLTGIECREE